MKTYKLYADGACRGNPGPGAYAWIIFEDDNKVVSGTAKFVKTTNNRMELQGVLLALDCIEKESTVHLYSDSMYVIKTIKGLYSIKANLDLWFRYHEIVNRKKLKIITHKVKGHSGDIWNEWCDRECNRILDDETIESGFDLNFERRTA